MIVSEQTSARQDAAPVIPAKLAARYTPLFEIGRGGMGTIEVALDAQSERVVALKRMHPSSGARERRQTEMFLREARLAASLVHPNVVHAFDYGESEGELFLAMEYVEGETLSAIVSAARARTDGGLRPEIIAAILADACEGLHAAHELRDPQTGAALNVIHRDVSPHNVMVSYEGHVKLLDFGVAKIDSMDHLTRTGEVKGKTAYMSPEQGMGDPLDRRSDLFTIGAVLFECVTGERMYGSGTEIEILRRLALEEPPTLGAAAPWAPPALQALQASLVAKKRENRPTTALAVAQALRRFVVESGTKVDAGVVAAEMARLFDDAAAQRKELLNEALGKRVTPAQVVVLRRSLAGPTALDSVVPSERAQAEAARTILVDAPPALPLRSSAPPTPTRATRRGVVASVAAGLIIAAGVVVAMTRAPRTSQPALRVETQTVTPVPIATPSASPAAPVEIPPAAASASVTPSAPSIATTPTPARRPHRPKPAASSQHVDVDTNPL